MATNYGTIVKGFTKTIKLCETRINQLKIAKGLQNEIVIKAEEKKTELHDEQNKVEKLLNNLNKLLA